MRPRRNRSDGLNLPGLGVLNEFTLRYYADNGRRHQQYRQKPVTVVEHHPYGFSRRILSPLVVIEQRQHTSYNKYPAAETGKKHNGNPENNERNHTAGNYAYKGARQYVSFRQSDGIPNTAGQNTAGNGPQYANCPPYQRNRESSQQSKTHNAA